MYYYGFDLLIFPFQFSQIILLMEILGAQLCDTSFCLGVHSGGQFCPADHQSTPSNPASPPLRLKAVTSDHTFILDTLIEHIKPGHMKSNICLHPSSVRSKGLSSAKGVVPSASLPQELINQVNELIMSLRYNKLARSN
jgi:hypothetical protein